MTHIPVIDIEDVNSVIVRGADSKIGSGGQGDVYKLDPAFSFGGQHRLVFKRYNKDSLLGRETALGLLWREIISSREELKKSKTEKDKKISNVLLRDAAWPIALVEENKTVCGILEPNIDNEWLNPSHVPGSIGQLRTWMVANHPKQISSLRARGHTPLSPEGRARTAKLILTFFAFLHSKHFVIGDISDANILVFVPASNQDKNLRLGFLEIENLRIDRYGSIQENIGPANTPGYEVPEFLRKKGIEKQEKQRAQKGSYMQREDLYVHTQASDVYKTAKLLLNLFSQNEEGNYFLTIYEVTPAIRESLMESFPNNSVCDVLKQALREEPPLRPSMLELCQAFH